MKSLVFITGAAGGLGKAFAVECASRGWDLFLTDLSDDALACLAASLINTYGVDVLYRRCDLADAGERASMLDSLDRAGFRFNFLVNVAGLDHEGLFAEKTSSQILSIIRLNIEANLEVTHGILKLRDPAKTFHIINVSSLAAYYPMPLKAAYASSKRFLLDFSMALREELRPINATVTALCPAGMPTTPECVKAIEAQGIAGRITACNVGYVAAGAIDKALAGRAVFIPGFANRLVKATGSIFPPALAARVIGLRWKAAIRKRSIGAHYA